MTHDRLIDLTTKLHEANRLSVTEAREFAQLLGKDDPYLKAVAFRLFTQTYTIEDAEYFCVACRFRFGCVLGGKAQ